MRHQLLSSIQNNPWYITPEYAATLAPFVKDLINGTSSLSTEEIAYERNRRAESVISLSSYEQNESEAMQQELQYVAVVNLLGPVLKHSQYCGPVGTTEIANKLQQLLNQDNVVGAIVLIESGGGEAYAVKPLAEVIKNSTKPIIAYAEDLMASAAYFIGSYATEVWANSPQARIGSIGTMISFADIRPMWEAQGVVFHEVYASKSTDKNEVFNQALDKKYDRLINEVLDPFNDHFHAEVRANRATYLSSKSEVVFKGGVFDAEKAIELGLINTIGSLQQAADRVVALADEQKEKNNSNPISNNMKLNLKPSMVALATWLGIGASETERQVELTEAQTEQWEAEIKELGDLRTQVKTLTETATTNATALTAIAKERDEYKTKADEYGKQPGQVAGAAVVKAEDPAIDAKEEPYLTSVDKEKASLKAKGQI